MRFCFHPSSVVFLRFRVSRIKQKLQVTISPKVDGGLDQSSLTQRKTREKEIFFQLDVALVGVLQGAVWIVSKIPDEFSLNLVEKNPKHLLCRSFQHSQ